MRYLALIAVVAHYTPGETYHHQSGHYPGMQVSRAGA